MIPLIENYPHFEVNQVLTNEQLNTLFAYTDEQNRLTRTHLSGVGIVCGLDAQTAANGSNITITRGCGVTSEGYLVVQDADVVHRFRRPYTAPKEVQYLPFLDGNGDQFPLWELLPASPPGDGTVAAIDSNFLNGKIILLFVELNKTANKNCLPNSCDDKGATISVTVRPLLVSKGDADKIKTAISYYTAKSALPDMRMPRFNVLSSTLRTTDDVVNAYRNILTKAFIADTVVANLQALVNTYSFLGFPANDINNALESIKGLPFDAANKLLLTRQYFYQYYYDFISDLVDAYNEIKQKAAPILAACCPDPAWFRRHLFLKEALNPPTPSQYRHYFIPSPITAKEGQAAAEIIQLFQRLYLMAAAFPEIAAPAVLTGSGVINSDTRITPSFMGGSLSQRSIPHYYSQTPQANGQRVFETWNYRLSKAGKAAQNLSYRAVEYPATDDFVKTPLKYDLEPYNFFRIEGHVGKNYKASLKYITSVIKSNRLPFDVVAVKTGNKADNIDVASFSAHFEDLETAYLLLWDNVKCKGVSLLDPIDTLAKVTPQIIAALRAQTPVKCEADQLEELAAAYKKRTDALKEAFLLSNYSEKHVGLQHKGGVPVGGTFVMVYHGEMVAPPPVAGGASGLLNVTAVTVGGNTFNRYTVNKQVARLYNVDSKSLQTYTTLVEALNPDDPKTMKVAEDAFLAMIPQNKAIRNTGIFRDTFRAALPVEVTEGIVFADFFLPYKCCSDGTPVQYIIQEQPLPLELVIEEEKCVNGSNVVTFRVNGGAPPYYVNNVEVKSKFTRTFGPNQGGQVIVLDSQNATSAVTVTPQTCPPVCDLPCNGISYICRYPAWLAKPVENIPKDALFIEFAYLNITDDKGAVIFDEDFSTLIREITERAGEINNGNYHGWMEEIVKAINESIRKKLPNYKGLVFEYDAGGRDDKQTGHLRIRYLQCHRFEFRIVIRAKDVDHDYRYTNSGVDVSFRIKGQESRTRIPKFGCVQIDECQDKSTEDCRINEFAVEREGNRLFIKFLDGYKTAYWLAGDAMPAFATGLSMEIKALGLPVVVRVILLNEQGCWGYQEVIYNEG
ncbi:hypothetical protein [Chitinophaga alhagiae]|uniref:hypothetical protein n=1 Tax=Chitinophaga alhagiae TaxID=2203219 RepID=UPI000E5AACAA|nr:hypothetical protein [Chitinophaga alhagiae]